MLPCSQLLTDLKFYVCVPSQFPLLLANLLGLSCVHVTLKKNKQKENYQLVEGNGFVLPS